MQDSEGKPPPRWKDLKDWERQARERFRRWRRAIENFLKEWLKPCPASTAHVPPASGPPKPAPSKKSAATPWMPERPVHNCERDEITGIYYCPYGCGGISKDPWEAMFHEVAHVADLEDMKELRKAYEEKMAAQEMEGKRSDETPSEAPGTKPRQARMYAVLALPIAGVCLFGWLVWPTPYRYDRMILGPVSYPVRINRLSGETEILRPGGWMAAQPSPEAKEEELPAAELGKLKVGAVLGDQIEEVEVYNGSSFTVDEVTFQVEIARFVKGKDLRTTMQRLYRATSYPGVPSLEAGRFTFDLGSPVSWEGDIMAVPRIVSARGKR